MKRFFAKDDRRVPECLHSKGEMQSARIKNNDNFLNAIYFKTEVWTYRFIHDLTQKDVASIFSYDQSK